MVHLFQGHFKELTLDDFQFIRFDLDWAPFHNSVFYLNYCKLSDSFELNCLYLYSCTKNELTFKIFFPVIVAFNDAYVKLRVNSQ